MKLRLSFPDTGETAYAEMLEEDAPGVCEYVRSILPVETKAIHGMYSGAEIFTLIDRPKPVPAENRVTLPLPGELLYFYDDGAGGVVRGGPWARSASSTDAAWCYVATKA